MKMKKMLVVSTAVLALFAAGGSVASGALEGGATVPPGKIDAVVSKLAAGAGKVTATAVPEPAIAIIGVVGVMMLLRRRSVGRA